MREERTIAERLAAGETAYTATKGTSMQPLLYQGRTHVVLRPPDRPLKVGDLPIYRRPDGVYVIHRLVKIGDGFYRMLGDNSIHAEEIPQDWVIGLVTKIWRGRSYLSVTDPEYRLYVRFWMLTAPVRITWKKVKLRSARLLHGKDK